jgi:hypothetical protein
VFVNNSVVTLIGSSIAPHKCGKVVHGGAAASSSGDVSIEQ